MRSLLWLTLASLAWPSWALTVEVVGQAPMQGAPSYIREQAYQNALQQAVLQSGVQVSSTQLMSQGVITQDELSVRASGQVSQAKVLWESQANGLYQVAVEAEVEPNAMCPKRTQHYRKTITVAPFRMAKPAQASLGYLQNIEYELPHVLTNSLNNRGLVHAFDNNSKPNAQYVLSGVVRDLSTLEESVGRPSWRERVGMNNKVQRQFVLDVQLQDGLSGAVIFQRSYSTQGVWQAHPAAQIGFATPEFWHTDYGQQVRALMGQVLDDVNETLRCQPFMARIIKAEANRLYIEAGAGTGLRPGDKLKVFRTGTFYNLDFQPRTELTNMATEAVVKQVQPQFVVAELNTSAGYLAIQRDDMVVAF